MGYSMLEKFPSVTLAFLSAWLSVIQVVARREFSDFSARAVSGCTGAVSPPLEREHERTICPSNIIGLTWMGASSPPYPDYKSLHLKELPFVS